LTSMDKIPTSSTLLFFAFCILWIKSYSAEQIQFAVLSDQGQSCQEACMTRHSTCDLMELNRRNEEQMIDILKRELEIKCMMDDRTWWSFDQPSVVVDPLDKNFGRCLGWKGKPKYHDCSARWPTVRRVCLCSKTFSCLAKKWIR
ncbi:hypothetical protein T09_4930, partial [Trichinella sp. T9]